MVQYWNKIGSQRILTGLNGHQGFSAGAPHENRMSLSSSKVEKFEFDFFDGGTQGRRAGGWMDGRPSDLYYLLVIDKKL